MTQKPVVLPNVFPGEKNWDEWIDHFDSVAAVNGREAAAKLQCTLDRESGDNGFLKRCGPTAS